MRFRNLSILLYLASVYTGAAQESTQTAITDEDGWKDVFSRQDVFGNYVLETNLSGLGSTTVSSGRELNIDLGGKKLTFKKGLTQGILVESGATLILRNGTLADREATGNLKGFISNRGTTILDQVTLSGSEGTGYGMAIYNCAAKGDPAPQLIVTDSVIKNNTMFEGSGRTFGAAVYNAQGFSQVPSLSVAEPGAVARFSRVQFINNLNHEGYGGAIANGSTGNAAGTVYVTGCTFWGNEAVEDKPYPNELSTAACGGAIANIKGKAIVVDSSFYSNRADLGGAIMNRDRLTVRAENEDVHFANNTMHSHRDGSTGNADDYIEGANDIYLDSVFSRQVLQPSTYGYLNHTFLEAKEGRAIFFGGGIRGLNNKLSEDGSYYESVFAYDNVVWINKDGEDGTTYAGTVYFESGSSVQSVNMSLYNGTMVVGDGDVFYSGRNKGDATLDRVHLRDRNNFALLGGTLDLSRLLTGSFSVENLTLAAGNVQFGTVREHHLQSLIIGSSGWSDSHTETIVFSVDCLSNYNKARVYTLLDYVDEDLTDADLSHFELKADHYGDGWVLRIVDGDLVLRWEGEDDGGDCPPCDLPHEPVCPGLPEVDSERRGELVENSLWGLDTNMSAMGNGALEQLNTYRMAFGPCRNLWVQGIGDFANQKSRGGADGFDYAGGGYSAGMDGRLCGGAGYLGVAIGQIWGTMQSRNYASEVDQDTMMGTLYWGNMQKVSEDQAWLFKGALTFGQSENRLRATYADGSSATGKWDNNGWLLQMEASCRFKVNEKWALSPLAGLEYAEGKRDAFRTRGYNTPDTVYEQSRLRRLTVPVGVQVDRRGVLGQKPWTNTLKLAYAFDVSRSDPDSFAQMEGFRSWKVGSAEPSRHAFRADFNTMLDLTERWRVFAGYLLEARGDSGVYHQVKAGVSFSF